ncbi:transcriptional regulatory protein, putative [Ferroglobus placidus DSM 10642]|uniref:Transcriptional regulatory protein, putative n=1 Tax=Ferroglobus placidus (strain DSM 10642 / AEDII12DO) TaxID=589924 RepID=D3RZ19_FERPA|nr:helix-turn-helix domain-containing protein [Ferroglobus placidus]ADC65732.1 transcriptional regulatory protein, putative [Ferroglobus placidus DSM 10642]
MKESWSEFSESVEKSREYHKRYHIAVNNKVRRKILKLIKEGKSYDEILEELGISEEDFEYHLKILEWGFCIVRDGKKLELTKEGEVVDYIGE